MGDVECYHAIFAELPEPNETEWAEAGSYVGGTYYYDALLEGLGTGWRS